MLELRNLTRGSSRVGYLVKKVTHGFQYAGVGDTPIGVVTEAVPMGMMCKIQTAGEALVYVGHIVVEGEPLRMSKAGEGGLAGVAYSAKNDTNYVSIGITTDKGKGLVSVALNLTPPGVTAGGSLPAGGTAGQALVKVSGDDNDVTWSTITSGISDAPSDDAAYSRRNASWVNSNLIIDYSGGTGAQTAVVNYDERFTIVGDGTYIGSTYSTYVNALSQTIHQIEIDFTPGALDTEWFLMVADGQVATGRSYDRAGIRNDANVAFLEGAYTTISYNLNTDFGDYSPSLGAPVNEVTIDLDTAALDVRYYTQSAADALFATQSWVNSNFDNYASWGIVDGVFTRDIESGESVEFSTDTPTYIQVQYDGEAAGVHSMKIDYVGPTTFYSGWDLLADAGSGFTRVGSEHDVNLAGGSNITTTYGFVAGSPAVHTVTFALDSSITLTSVQAGTITSTGSVIADTYFQSSDNDVIIGPNAAGVVYLRPNGYASATDQFTVGVSQTTARNTFQVEDNTATVVLDGSTTGAAAGCVIRMVSTSTTRARGIQFENDGTAAEWWAGIGYNVGDDYVIGYDATGGQPEYSTNAIVRITPAGRVGIGADPSYPLHVAGNGFFEHTAGVATIIATASHSSGVSSIIRLRNTNTGQAAGAHAGDIQFYKSDASTQGAGVVSRIFSEATDAGGTYKLQFETGQDVETPAGSNGWMYLTYTGNLFVENNVIAGGEVEAYDTSDIRIKNNIEFIPYSRSSQLLDVQVIEYDHIHKEKHEIGLIAQEIKEIFPEVVKEDKEGILMIHYSKLLAPMLQLIQNQERRINELERRAYH